MTSAGIMADAVHARFSYISHHSTLENCDLHYLHHLRSSPDRFLALMLFSAHVASFALALGLVAAADISTEGTPLGSLYAYGSGLSGLPVIYSDGERIALISNMIYC